MIFNTAKLQYKIPFVKGKMKIISTLWSRF